MVDSLPISKNQPLGHHQPLGGHSLGVLNLAYFFPTGLPDIDPIDEDSAESSQASPIHRKFSPESTSSELSNVSRPFSYQNPSPSEGTSSQLHPSHQESSPNQAPLSSEDGFPRDKSSIFTSTTNIPSLQKQLSPEANKAENLLPKIIPTSESPDIQKNLEIEARSTPEIVQPDTNINSEYKIIQDHKFPSSDSKVDPDETAFKGTAPFEEKRPQENILPGNSTLDISPPEVAEFSGNNIIQKNSESNSSSPESLQTSNTNSNPPFNLNYTTSSETVISDQSITKTTLDTTAHTARNDTSSRDIKSEKTLSNNILASQESANEQKILAESTPVIFDSDTLSLSSRDSSAQRFSSPENIGQENGILGSIPSDINISEEAQETIFHSLREEQHQKFSPNTEGDQTPLSENHVPIKNQPQFPTEDSRTSITESHTFTANQPQFSSDSFAENTVISTPNIQAKNVAPTPSSASQAKAIISPTPGTEALTSSSHDHLPVIIDFSTPPELLQPQQITDNSTVNATNSSSRTTASEPSVYADSPSSEIPFKPDIIQSEPALSQGSHSVNKTNGTFSAETRSEHEESSLAPATSPQEIASSPSGSIQRASESSLTDSVVNPSNSETGPLDNEALTRSEDLVPQNLVPKIDQDSVESSNFLASEHISLPSKYSATPEISSKASEPNFNNIQKTSESRSELVIDRPASSEQRLPGSENTSEIEQASHQSVQEYSEENTSLPIGIPSAEEISILKPSFSTELEGPTSEPIQRVGEDNLTVSVDSIDTDTLQTFKTATSQNSGSSLAEQPQQEVKVDSNFPTDTASTSEITALDTEFSTHDPWTPSRQVQRVSEGSSISTGDVESALIAKDLFSEPTGKVQQNQSTFSSNVFSEPTAEVSTPQVSPAIEAFIPDQIQKSDTSLSSFSADENSEFDTLSLVDKGQPSFTLSSLIQPQRSSEEISEASIDKGSNSDTSSTLDTAYQTHKIPLDIEESAPDQIHKAGESSSTFSTDLDHSHNLENLVDKPFANIDRVSLKQNQTIREASPIPPTNSAPIPAITALESQSSATAREMSSHPVQNINEDNSTSAENIILRPTTEASLAEIHPGIEASIPKQIQKFDGARSPFSENIDSEFQTTNLGINKQSHIEETVLVQLQRDGEEISVFPTDMVSASSTTPLTQTLDIGEAAPKQIQKAGESGSTASTDIVSEHNLKNVVNKPLGNLDQLSCDQSQAIREKSPPSPVDAEPIPAITSLDLQTSATAENTSPESIQKTEKNHPTFLANVASEATIEALPATTQTITEGSTPAHIQKASENSSTFPTGTNLIYPSDNLAHETPTDIEMSSPNNIQETTEASFPRPTVAEFLPSNISLDSQPVISTENTFPKQVQRTSQADHSLTGIEASPKTALVSDLNLGAEPTKDLQASSLHQIQSIVEDSISFQGNKFLLPETTAREPQLLDPIKEEPSRQIQRVTEDDTLSSEGALSKAEPTTSAFQDSVHLETRSDEIIQSTFEENTNFSKDDLSPSSKSDFELELQVDTGATSDQELQRVIEQDSSPLIDSNPKFSAGNSTPKAISNLQFLSPNQTHRIHEEYSFSPTENLPKSATLSSESVSFDDHQETLLQGKRDFNDTSSNHTVLPASITSKKLVSLDSKPILSSESSLPNGVEKSQGDKAASRYPSSPPPVSISTPKGLVSEHSASTDNSLQKQIQRTDEKDISDLEDTESTNFNANLAPELLSDIKEKSAEQVQKSAEEYSGFSAHTTSAQITILTPQKIGVTGSAHELISPDLGAPFELTQNHTVIQQHQQIPSSDKALSLEKIQLHRDPDPSISLDHLSQSLTSFLSPEILPKYNDTPSNTIQPSRDTTSSALVRSISSPAAATPRSDLWRTIVDNSSEAFQDSSQAYLASRPNSEGSLLDIIQKNSENKDVVEPETISSASLYSADSLSNFESVQPHNIQTPDVQGFDAETAAVNAQVVNQHPMVISRTEAVLPSQIQRVNEINPLFSTDGKTDLETTPIVDSIAADRGPQFQNLSFQNVQRTHASHFDNLTSLSTTNPKFSEIERLPSPNQTQSPTQDNSIHSFGDSAFPPSATSTFIANVINPRDLFSAANASSNSIQRWSEGNSSSLSDIESIHSALGAPSSLFLKSEDLALGNSLESKVSETTAINPTSIDINAVQEPSIGEQLNQSKVVHKTIKTLPTWPESLASSKNIGFHQTSEHYETLPVVIDFQAPPRSLHRKAEIEPKTIDHNSDVDSLIHREEETHLSASYSHSLDKNQATADADTTQDQRALGEVGIQSFSMPMPTMQPQTDLSSISHHSEINQNAQALSADSELMGQSWLSQKTESDLSKPAQLSEIDDTMVQRLEDDHSSALPLEWQSLADLVASQAQNSSPKTQPTPWDIPEPRSSQEVVEPSPNSSSVPLTTSSPFSTKLLQRKLSISRSKPVLKFRNPPAIQTQNTSHPDSSQPNFLIQAKQDTPFTTIEANQSHVSENNDGKSWALEQLAQEIYYRMRQRLIVERERYGRLYDKRLK